MTESRSPVSRHAARRAAALLAVACAVALAGCGGGQRVAAGATLRVALREYRITPQKVSAGAGSLTIDVANDGRLTHSLLITTAAGKHVAQSDPVAPGQSTTVTAELARGHYLMTSGVQSDKALGLYGTLNVG